VGSAASPGYGGMNEAAPGPRSLSRSEYDPMEQSAGGSSVPRGATTGGTGLLRQPKPEEGSGHRAFHGKWGHSPTGGDQRGCAGRRRSEG
jgi:hypothetical protein